MTKSSKCLSSLQVSQPKSPIHFSYAPHMLHAPPTSSSFNWQVPRRSQFCCSHQKQSLWMTLTPLTDHSCDALLRIMTGSIMLVET